MHKCPLCLGDELSIKHKKNSGEVYWDCLNCHLIFLDPTHHLTPDKEKAHYQTHNNDVTDVRYQKFVSPIVDYVTENISVDTLGLDFGCGTGPVITAMLREKGYSLKLYDPFFCDDLSALTYRYDFIVTCEVIEHFYSPMDEFNKIKFLLKPSGTVVMMTDVYNDEIDFPGWYYHRDPTHVCFYRKETFYWIAKNFGFNDVKFINNRTIAMAQ